MQTRLALILSLTLCAGAAKADPPGDPQGAPAVQQGAAIAERRCTRCHAVASEADSPEPAAPRFRELYLRYAPATLEAAIRDGLLTSHPMMPEFRFAPGDVDALVRYLQSIQARQPG